MGAIADGEPIVRRLDEPTHLLGPERPADLQRAKSLPDQLFRERLGLFKASHRKHMGILMRRFKNGRLPFRHIFRIHEHGSKLSLHRSVSVRYFGMRPHPKGLAQRAPSLPSRGRRALTRPPFGRQPYQYRRFLRRPQRVCEKMSAALPVSGKGARFTCGRSASALLDTIRVYLQSWPAIAKIAEEVLPYVGQKWLYFLLSKVCAIVPKHPRRCLSLLWVSACCCYRNNVG